MPHHAERRSRTLLNEAKEENQYWNIPIANTTCLLLGTGTSVTQAAMRMLASAGVLVGFCGGGGTPLLMANEIEWLTPQSEYRPTEYMQGWMQFWFDENKRLAAARKFQQARITYLQTVWAKDRDLAVEGFTVDDADIATAIIGFNNRSQNAKSVGNLLQTEAELTNDCTSLQLIRHNTATLCANVRQLTKPMHS